MIVYLWIVCMSESGCFNYEYKDKIQCEHSVEIFKDKTSVRGMISILVNYCQEVRK